MGIFTERARYYFERGRKGGLRFVALKVRQKIRPLFYLPVYFLGRRSKTTGQERDALREFGAICIEAFSYVRRTDPGRRARVIERLQLAEGPHFPVLGYGDLVKPRGNWWHTDARHGYSWAVRYFPFCDFIASDVRSDVKIPWELSRLQWVVWLAEASVDASPEEHGRLRAQFLDTLFDWAKANPPGYGINWTCAMEVAIRGANIAIAAGVFSRELDDFNTNRLCEVLRAHQEFLSRFPEVSDVPGNHYLADLMGEVVMHAALDGLNCSTTSRALALFAEAAAEQFESGGCHIERATIYHRLTVDVVALPYALALRAKDPSARSLELVMARAAAFMAQIADDGGRLPVFGDQDSGFVLWFGEAAQQADERLCSAPLAPSTDLYSFLSALAGGQDPGTTFFPPVVRQCGDRCGFATRAGGGFRVTLKTGPLGLEGRAPHDHDDALSVTISHGAKALVIDPGCHSYTLDPAIRRESIVSSRHNAPAPVARERFTPTTGSINATMRGAPTAMLFACEFNGMKGRLERVPLSGMAITRTVRLQDGTLEILDNWHFDSPEGARLLWLVAPAWQLDGPQESGIPPDGMIFGLRCGTSLLTARIEAPEGSCLTRRETRFSPNYGAWAACPALEITTPPAKEGAARLSLYTAEAETLAARASQNPLTA